MYVCDCVYLSIYLLIHRTYIQICMYIHTHVYMYTYIYNVNILSVSWKRGCCIDVYVHTCLYTYVYISTHFLLFGLSPGVKSSISIEYIQNIYMCVHCVVWGEVGGWGRDPKKCTGRDWGMGSSIS